MAQFGKRNAIAAQPGFGAYAPRPGTPPADTYGNGGASPRPCASQPDVSAALAVVQGGKMPFWTTCCPVRLIILALCAAAGLWHLTATYAGETWRDHRLARFLRRRWRSD